MQNIFVSFSPLNMFILLGEDPNNRPGTFIKLSGIRERITQFQLTILNEQLSPIYTQSYKDLDAVDASLMEFYTGGHPEGKLLRLQLDDFEKTISLAS